MKTTLGVKDKKDKRIVPLIVLCLTVALLCVASIRTCSAYVEIRISVNFILDANGNRPHPTDVNGNPEGNFETDQDVRDAIALGNEILSTCESEFRLELVGDIDDVDDGGRFFADEWTDDTWNDVHARATNPDHSAQYHWRTDAINLYINEGPWGGTAISHPNSRMFGMSARADEVTILHETCHILGMVHTWNSLCDDVAEDHNSQAQPWQTFNDIDIYTNEVWGSNFNALTSHEQWLAENTFFNVMCYRTVRDRLTPCQLDNMAEGGDWYAYRGQVFTDLPIYINSDRTGGQTGNFMTPYHTLVKALDDESIDNRVLVFEGGNNYTLDRILNADTELVPRLGTVKIYPESSFQASSISVPSQSLGGSEGFRNPFHSEFNESSERVSASTRNKHEQRFKK